jgi:stage V sporulation protein AB
MLIGLGEGLVVGTALIAFLLVLNIIPRLIRFGGLKKYIKYYQPLIVLGAFLATNFQFYDWQLPTLPIINQLLVIGCGLIFGIFVGLLAGALTETLKVLPVLKRRLGLKLSPAAILEIIILGKATGSLIYWLFPELWP